MSPGTKAWVGMAAGIAAYDIWAMLTGNDTMSHAFGEALDHPVNKWLVLAAWTFTTKHLFLRNLAPWSDPFNLLSLSALGIQKIYKVIT